MSYFHVIITHDSPSSQWIYAINKLVLQKVLYIKVYRNVERNMITAMGINLNTLTSKYEKYENVNLICLCFT
jgi:hypothetical protein